MLQYLSMLVSILGNITVAGLYGFYASHILAVEHWALTATQLFISLHVINFIMKFEPTR